MCLSTVYKDTHGQVTQVMQDVSRMEAMDDGVLLIGMFGEEIFVRGRLKSMDFLDGKSMLVEADETDV
jgi:predicted RNA-binding protein